MSNQENTTIFQGVEIVIFGDRADGYGCQIGGRTFCVPQGAFEVVYRAQSPWIALDVAQQLISDGTH
jgi:hypothetical protein